MPFSRFLAGYISSSARHVFGPNTVNIFCSPFPSSFRRQCPRATHGTKTYGLLVESNKSRLNRAGLSRHTLERILRSVSAQLDYIEQTFAVETILFQHKPTPKSFSLTTFARGHNFKKLLGSETGEKIKIVLWESSKSFPRPDPEKHLGYKNILLKAGKQFKVEEETNQAKDPFASNEALERFAQAEALKASKASKTKQNKNNWIAKKNPRYNVNVPTDLGVDKTIESAAFLFSESVTSDDITLPTGSTSLVSESDESEALEAIENQEGSCLGGENKSTDKQKKALERSINYVNSLADVIPVTKSDPAVSMIGTFYLTCVRSSLNASLFDVPDLMARTETPMNDSDMDIPLGLHFYHLTNDLSSSSLAFSRGVNVIRVDTKIGENNLSNNTALRKRKLPENQQFKKLSKNTAKAVTDDDDDTCSATICKMVNGLVV